jgi:hypothetical protein
MKISQYSKKAYENWKDKATGDYGIQGFYELDKLQPFKQEFIRGKRAIQENDSSY